MGAVQRDVEAGQVEVGEALVQGAQVVLLGAVQGAHAPDATCSAPAARSRRASIAASVSSESLKPSAAKNLMPLSR